MRDGEKRAEKDEASKSSPATPGSVKPGKPEEEKAKGLGYVFKVVRADPKNSLDFEDVADK